MTAPIATRGVSSTSAAGNTSATPANIPAIAGASAILNQRLISFDSTDPEFDEDSDPDADLDL
jgi:hypothetical protein